MKCETTQSIFDEIFIPEVHYKPGVNLQGQKTTRTRVRRQKPEKINWHEVEPLNDYIQCCVEFLKLLSELKSSWYAHLARANMAQHRIELSLEEKKLSYLAAYQVRPWTREL